MRAVAVHLYTAGGAVLALLMLGAAFQGEAVRALWLMLAALAIDSTDGLLARRLRVREALPSAVQYSCRLEEPNGLRETRNGRVVPLRV